MEKRYIKKFESFQIVKRIFDKATNEAVVQFDDKYRVGGIEVPQSLINSYVKKTKDEAGKNLRQLYSDQEIAELLVKYVAANKLDVDKIPALALLGGDQGMEDDMDIDTTTNTNVDTTGLESTEEVEPGSPEDINTEVPNSGEGDVVETAPNEDEISEPEASTDNEETFEEPIINSNEGEQEKAVDNETKEEGEEEKSDEEKESEEEEETGDEDNEELPI